MVDESILQLSEISEKIESIRSLASGIKDHPAFQVQKGPPYYAHLVLQGGGTLGIAHLGAIHAFESVGIRFVGVAGTSAGAIIATLVTCNRDTPSKPIAKDLLPIVASMPTSEFVDGTRQIRKLINHAVGARRLPVIDLVSPVLRSLQKIRERFGLNRGIL